MDRRGPVEFTVYSPILMEIQSENFTSTTARSYQARPESGEDAYG